MQYAICNMATMKVDFRLLLTQVTGEETLSFNTCHTKKQFLQYYPKLAGSSWAVSLLHPQPHIVMKLWTHRNGKMGFSSSIASRLGIVQFC